MAICNKDVKGCIICQNRKISEIVDPIIFNAEMEMKSLKKKLDEQYGYHLEMTDLRVHAKHLYRSDDDYAERESNEIKKVNETTTLDQVKRSIAQVNIQIDALIKCGRDGTLEHAKLEKQRSDYLTLKAKLEGDINEGVVIVPEWLKRME